MIPTIQGETLVYQQDGQEQVLPVGTAAWFAWLETASTFSFVSEMGRFTEREREVLRLLMEGASNREIAQRLVLSINTVKRHIYNICGKLGVQSRTQALVKARALNLL